MSKLNQSMPPKQVLQLSAKLSIEPKFSDETWIIGPFAYENRFRCWYRKEGYNAHNRVLMPHERIMHQVATLPLDNILPCSSVAIM